LNEKYTITIFFNWQLSIFLKKILIYFFPIRSLTPLIALNGESMISMLEIQSGILTTGSI
jgi:hypothetical protein